ncbi:MAG: hypothetical protein FJX75_29995 [Armatimonadetes bacterium]|nr:hypothetical protein [Armatimonadota bacterium]
MAPEAWPRGPLRHGVAAVWIAGLGLLTLAGCQPTAHQDVRKATQAADALDAVERAQRQVDPRLVTYRQVTRVETGQREPRGVAFGADGTLYVVGDQEVRVFSATGTLQFAIRLPEPPHCIAVDKSGLMAIGYRSAVRLHQASGNVQAQWPLAGARAYVTCVALSGEDVWVADAGDRVVLRYDRTGQLRGRLGERDTKRGVPGLQLPSHHLDVAVGPDKLLLVNNPGRLALETYTQEGKLVSSWGKAGMEIDAFCGCCNPTDIALLPDRRVITAEKGLPRVKVFRPDGRLDGVVATPDDLSAAASGADLAVDRDGRIAVLDPQARVVRLFVEKQKNTGGGTKS